MMVVSTIGMKSHFIATKWCHLVKVSSGAASKKRTLAKCRHRSFESVLKFQVDDEDQTSSLAQRLSSYLSAGDVLCFRGPVGSGKTFFCRSLIRSLTKDNELRVNSPTFLLLNVYNNFSENQPSIHHYDLYRLQGENDLTRLGWYSSLPKGGGNIISLVEWPNVLGDSLPKERLDIEMNLVQSASLSAELEEADFEDNGQREISFQGYGERWNNVLDSLKAALQRKP